MKKLIAILLTATSVANAQVINPPDLSGYPSAAQVTQIVAAASSTNRTLSDARYMSITGGDGYGVTNTPINSGFELKDNQPDISKTTMSFDNATRTFTLGALAPYRFTINNERWITVSTNQQIQISDTEGLHYIYFHPLSGEMTASTSTWTINGEAQIAQIYWDKVNQKCLYLGDERHGNGITDTEHKEHHKIESARHWSGGALSYNIASGAPSTSGSNTVVSISTCAIWDDDHTNQTAGLGNNIIAYTNDGAQFNIMYATGLVASVNWRTNGMSYFPFMLSPDGSRPCYNSVAGGVWSTNVVPEDNYWISWIVQVPSYQDGTRSGFVVIPHSMTFNSLTGAQVRTYINILENRMVDITSEMKPLYRLIFQKNETAPGAFNAAVKYTKLVEVQDLRVGNQNPTMGLGASQADLSVFLRHDGTVPASGNINLGGNSITNGSFVGNGSGLTNLPVSTVNQSPLTNTLNAAGYSITNINTVSASNIVLNGTGLTTNLFSIGNAPTNGYALTSIISGSTTQVLWQATTWVHNSYTNDWFVGNLVTNALTTNSLDLASGQVVVPAGVNVVYLRVQYGGTVANEAVNFYTTNSLGVSPDATVRCQVAGLANEFTAPIVIGTNRTIYYVKTATNIPTVFNIKIIGGHY